MAYLMVVDDDKDLANAVAIALRGSGHEVDIHLDTQSPLPAMEQRRPDLVILDVMFPENSSAGLELARLIRRHSEEEVKGIPILMLTAVNAEFPMGFSPRDIDDEWLPVTDFIEKPVDFAVLLQKISELLEPVGAPQDEGTV